MSLLEDAVELAARKLWDRLEADSVEHAKWALERDDGSNWDYSHLYDEYMEENRQIAARGEVSWEDAEEDDRDYCRRAVRRVVEDVFGFISGGALRQVADESKRLGTNAHEWLRDKAKEFENDE